MKVRGLKARLNAKGRYIFKAPESSVDHLVVGGGVVGLAIARRLAQIFPEKTTYLVERHLRAGEETSSRNSEVIHAGIYYPPDSEKTRLCLRGRHLLYRHCKEANVPFKKTGKLVVAREHQRVYIEGLHAKASTLQWPARLSNGHHDGPVAPTRLLSGVEARDMEPDLSSDIVAALWSPETGIVDSHAFMESLEKDIINSSGGQLVFSTEVVRVDPCTGMSGLTEGWIIQTVTRDASRTTDTDAILARTLINASGLSSTLIINSLLPEEYRVPMYYARGSYASYQGPGTSRISRLLYPCPDGRGAEGHSFQSLGTHLTLDMQGKIRFGPDLEWINPPAEDTDPDFWNRYLVPDVARIAEMHRAVSEYLPGVTLEGFAPDYVGIRPKLVAPPAKGFQDFTMRVDYPHSFEKSPASEKCGNPMITLLGIESPGLTASLAIAEMVVDGMLQRDRTL